MARSTRRRRSGTWGCSTVFPATDYLFAGGLTWEELQPILRPLLSSPALLGASIGCYNPEKDPDGRNGRELVGSLRIATS